METISVICSVIGTICSMCTTFFGFSIPKESRPYITNITYQQHEGYLVVGFEVVPGTALCYVRSVSIPGYKIARQQVDERGKGFSRYQLHLVISPSDEVFRDSLPIEQELGPRDRCPSGLDEVIVCKESTRASSSRKAMPKIEIVLDCDRWIKVKKRMAIPANIRPIL